MKEMVLAMNNLGVVRTTENRDMGHDWTNLGNLFEGCSNQVKKDTYYFLMLGGVARKK